MIDGKMILKLAPGEELSPEDLELLGVLLADSLAAFRQVRRDSSEYVQRNYEWLEDSEIRAKIAQVERRKALSMRLHNAALFVEVESE